MGKDYIIQSKLHIFEKRYDNEIEYDIGEYIDLYDDIGGYYDENKDLDKQIEELIDNQEKIIIFENDKWVNSVFEKEYKIKLEECNYFCICRGKKLDKVGCKDSNCKKCKCVRYSIDNIYKIYKITQVMFIG